MLLKLNNQKTPEVTEGGRRPTEGTSGVMPPDSEVGARAKRRTHTVAYKIRIVNTVATLGTEGHGAVGAFLRKEGLYYSMVKRWEHQLADGKLVSTNRGPKEKNRKSLIEENKQLKRKLERLEQRLAKTEMIVELQKKLSSILEMDQNTGNGKQDAQ